MAKFRSFLGETDGATSVEYALIAGFVSILIVLGATSIGTKLNSRFSYLSAVFS